MGYGGYNLVLSLTRRGNCREMGGAYRDDGLSCRVKWKSLPAEEDLLPRKDKTCTQELCWLDNTSEGARAVSLLPAPGRLIPIRAYPQGFLSRICRGSARVLLWLSALPLPLHWPFHYLVNSRFWKLESELVSNPCMCGKRVSIYGVLSAQSTMGLSFSFFVPIPCA